MAANELFPKLANEQQTNSTSKERRSLLLVEATNVGLAPQNTNSGASWAKMEKG
jgi:hypothetical protein